MVFYLYNCVSAHAHYARVKELLQAKQNFAAKLQRFDKKSKKYAATNAAKIKTAPGFGAGTVAGDSTRISATGGAIIFTHTKRLRRRFSAALPCTFIVYNFYTFIVR